jgi:hypothetical protein
MKLLISLLLVTTSLFSQIKVSDVGPKWKNRVDSALILIKKYDSTKYNLLVKHCKQIGFSNLKFSTIEGNNTIILSTYDIKYGSINNIASAIVHESAHLFFLDKNFFSNFIEEEEHCYAYELDFLIKIPNCEKYLINNALKNIINH